MFLLAVLTPLFALATEVVAGPSRAHAHAHARDSLLRIPISKRTNFDGISNFAKRDREHMGNLVKRSDSCNRRKSSTVNKTPSIPLNNTGGIYTATLGIGKPATYYQLLVDSGSALTWVGANLNKTYVVTPTSVKTKDTANMVYSNGFFNGLVYNDTVTISEGITISQQAIGVATNSSGFSPFDGVLGIGPTSLSLGILNPDSGMIVRTVTDNLFHQGAIQKDQVAVSFVPTNSFPTVNGEMTFGGVDTTKFIGGINYFPLATSAAATDFWSTDATFRYGNETILSTASGVFDTGSSLFGLRPDAYESYVKATGAEYDSTLGLLSIPANEYHKVKSLFFTIEHTTYEFNANAQALPHALNSLIGGREDRVYLVINELPADLDLGFVAGMAFLERFYVVFDSRRHRIGLANTQFTNSTSIN